jgi:alpha-L-rhamnosidase
MIFQPWIKVLMIASILAFLPRLAAASEETTGPFPPDNLRCEYLENPVGIDVKKPRFSWMLNHSDRGQTQSAYQVIAS